MDLAAGALIYLFFRTVEVLAGELLSSYEFTSAPERNKREHQQSATTERPQSVLRLPLILILLVLVLCHRQQLCMTSSRLVVNERRGNWVGPPQPPPPPPPQKKNLKKLVDV